MALKSNPNAQAQKRIAVVAVHGVGNPDPGDTAKSIAALLLRLEDGTPSGPYSHLTEETLTFSAGQLPQAPATPRFPSRNRDKEKRLFGWRSQYPADGSSFIHEQLQDFKAKNEDEEYETMRIRTQRSDGVQVDVHEIHWSDVTRRGKGFLRFFIELYQLLFHLSLLSEKTILSHYSSLGKKSGSWTTLRFLVFAASRYLTRVIVLYNLWLITPAVLFVACFLPMQSSLGSNWWMPCTGVAALGIMSAVAGSVLWFSKSASTQTVMLLWGIFGVLLLLAGAMHGESWKGTLGSWANELPTHQLMRAVAAFIVIVSGGTCFTFLFNQYHPNSENFGAVVGGVMAGAYAFCFGLPGDETTLNYNFFVLATLGFMVNVIVIIVLQIIVFLAGIAALKSDLFKPTQPGTRAFVTAILGLTTPAILIIVLTVALWNILDDVTLPLDQSHNSNNLPDILIGLGTTGSGGMVMGFSVALLIGFFILLPTIVVEVAAPKLNLDSSRHLGVWLTSGGRWLGFIAGLLFVAAIAPIPFQGYTLWEVLNGGNWKYSLGAGSASGLAVLVGSGGLILMLLKNYLEDWTTAFLPILERLLDVDEYLRDSPNGYTAKARIFNRYHALMHGLVSTGADGIPYDKIIILAHSQGAVISSDYLRYLHEIGQSWPTPIALFTMGNPLKQLYGWRFPTWYDWAWNGPRPAELGVQSWSNAYGAGDGVGRSHWRDPADTKTYSINLAGARYWIRGVSNGPWFLGSRGQRREICTGNTGHVHYWDTATNLGSEVAVELDRLIGP